LLEALISLALLSLVLVVLAGLLANKRINRAEQMTAAVQADARNCLSIVVQKLRSAGWDPAQAGIPTVALDPDLTDGISQIEIFTDLNADGLTTGKDESVLIRHIDNRLEWRRKNTGPFKVLAVNITNDADGDGISEAMFVPFPPSDPTSIRVRITARSPAPDPGTGKFIRYSVNSDVALRNSL